MGQTDTWDPSTLIGHVVADKYKITSILGRGGMGAIYEAEQLALQKKVAIKVLHQHLVEDPELIGRFHREAKAASRLDHPNCVRIFDFGSLSGSLLYLAMEHINGVDLATLLVRDYPLSYRRIVGIMMQVMLALDEAHANGVLHRDIKPENIMIEELRTVKEHVKVVDFGIAKLEDSVSDSNAFKTQVGMVCGTPEYMAPEQARGKTLDGRSDLYGVGVMMYHLVTGRLPFDGETALDIVGKHISAIPEAPSTYRNDIPPTLENLILSLMEKDREKRPQTAMDVHAELERIDRELAFSHREKLAQSYEPDATVLEVPVISTQMMRQIELSRASTDSPSTKETLGEAVKLSKSQEKKPHQGRKKKTFLIALAAIGVLVLGIVLGSALA